MPPTYAAFGLPAQSPAFDIPLKNVGASISCCFRAFIASTCAARLQRLMQAVYCLRASLQAALKGQRWCSRLYALPSCRHSVVYQLASAGLAGAVAVLGIGWAALMVSPSMASSAVVASTGSVSALTALRRSLMGRVCSCSCSLGIPWCSSTCRLAAAPEWDRPPHRGQPQATAVVSTTYCGLSLYLG